VAQVIVVDTGYQIFNRNKFNILLYHYHPAWASPGQSKWGGQYMGVVLGARGVPSQVGG